MKSFLFPTLNFLLFMFMMGFMRKNFGDDSAMCAFMWSILSTTFGMIHGIWNSQLSK
jgi:hypothetical protein